MIGHGCPGMEAQIWDVNKLVSAQDCFPRRTEDMLWPQMTAMLVLEHMLVLTDRFTSG